MSQTAVIRLIDSMSKEEKRKFKLSTKKQIGKKDYLDLFDIIDQNSSLDVDLLKEKFKKLHITASLDNTARYLLKVLTDCLIQTKIKEDNSFHLNYGLLRVKLLKARSLQEEAYKELKKLKLLAVETQNYFMQYVISREELNYISDVNFPGMTEKDLIEKQVQARDLLKYVRNTQEHHSLYELLRFRLVNSGKTLSEESKKQLNDLILNEMSLATGRINKNFESQKLHLLFQSFFFTDIGDYQSALKTFHVLNKLFEQNKALWNFPPIDYLSSLDGIIDCLRAIGYYDEMRSYIKKLQQLDHESYPEFFRFLVRKTIMIYQLTIFICKKEFEAAIQFISISDSNLLKAYSLVDEEKQSELLFCLGLAYFRIKNFKKAQKYINEIILIRKINYQSLIYKAAKLLGILIHYEDNNLEYLEYAIRSHKRTSENKGKLLKTEIIIFKTIKLHPVKNNPRKNELLWKKIAFSIKAIEKDKYEMQLGKYFDFMEWVRNKFLKNIAP